MEKLCTHCHQKYPLDNFYTSSVKVNRDGFTPWCKECWKSANRERHAKKRAGLPDKRRLKMLLVKHDYFATITRPLQAYILGLLASDGNVGSSRPRVKLGLHEKDITVVELVRDELAPGLTLSYEKCNSYQMVYVRLTSPQMCEDLRQYGIIPRKSLTLEWPERLPREFTADFLLGFFDGDGHLTIDKRKDTYYPIVGITCGSKSFLERAASEISFGAQVPLAVPSNVNRRGWCIRHGGRNAVRVNDWLHQNLCGLARKRIPPT